MNSRREYILLICILLLGIAVRIIKFNDPAFALDTVAFSRLGKNLIEYCRYNFGENYNMGVFFPPGYPFFIGLFNLAVKDLFVSAKLVSFVSSSITIILSYFVGKELYDKESGLFAAFVYALYPVILIVSVDTYSDVLFYFFLLLSIYLFLISLRRNNYFISVLFGVSVAASYLTRPEGQFLLLLPLLQVFGVFNERLFFNRKYLLKLVSIFVVFGIIIFPYMLFLKNYTGKFSPTGKANISILLGELSDEAEYHEVVNAPDNLYDRKAFALTGDKTQLEGWNREANRSLKDYIFKDPLAFAKRYQKNVLREIKTLNKLLIPIALPFFFAFFNKELFRKRTRLIFIMFPLLFFLIYPIFIIIEKQTLVIVVFLIFFSCGGFPNARHVFSDLTAYYGLENNRALQLAGRNIKHIMIAVLALSSLIYLKYSSFDKVERAGEHEAAGLYLKEKVPAEYEELNVMAAKPYVNYYSGARFTMLPYASSADVIRFGRINNVDFIVIDERFLGKWESYNELMEMHRHSDEVELFYEGRSDKLIRLFRIRKQIIR
ncbi:MAG: glycosyltransferase family 39 protein [Nitrospirae bacterium]|nr:glycosyltransferase family 39 protein [Nitrospirota bacterium]